MDDFYAARSRAIPPLPWSNIAPPFSTALAAAIAIAAPSNAQVYNLGGWEVENTWNQCTVSMIYEGVGETLLTISYHREEEFTIFGVANKNWTVKPREKFKVSFLVDGWEYTQMALGADLETRKGFGVFAADDFLASIANGDGVMIKMAETGTLIDNLTLKGSAAAIERLKACRASMRAQVAKEKREKERLDYIPTDPFAKPTQ